MRWKENKFEQALSFDDVHVVPQESYIRSRKQIDLTSTLNRTDIKMGLPFFASPMDTVSGPEMAIALWKTAGAIAIIHRYCDISVQADMVKRVAEAGAVCGAAVGTQEDAVARATAAVDAGAQLICVDVAHGHHILVKETIMALREKFPNLHIMAGNIATKEGYIALSSWGADSVRVGIGSGSICVTRQETGHGYPALESLLDIASFGPRPTQIILDGGIRYAGDIVKALAAGADFVMMGSMLAGTAESPGEIIRRNDKQYKVYRGQASKESQIDWKGSYSSNEGVSTCIPYKGAVAAVLDDLERGIRSGLSYSGSSTLSEFRNKAIMARVSSASAIEASPHILRRSE